MARLYLSRRLKCETLQLIPWNFMILLLFDWSNKSYPIWHNNLSKSQIVQHIDANWCYHCWDCWHEYMTTLVSSAHTWNNRQFFLFRLSFCHCQVHTSNICPLTFIHAYSLSMFLRRLCTYPIRKSKNSLINILSPPLCSQHAPYVT